MTRPALMILIILVAGNAFGQADKLLLTEVKITSTAGEFIEIYNPNSTTVQLDNYYLTDATFSGGNQYYYNIVDAANLAAGGGGFGDFHAKFPTGSSIGPGEAQTISISGSDNFLAEFGIEPNYELYEDGASADAIPDMEEAFAGSVNGQGGLTNGGEFTTLYYWDGSSDLVTDIDYMVWGDKVEAVDKSGITIDGPDADATGSTYQNDTPIANQDVVATGSHSSANSYQRLDLTEGNQVATGGNGVGGRDETSEDLSATWTSDLPPTPGFVIEDPIVTLSIDEESGNEIFESVITIEASTDRPVSGAQTIEVQVTGTGITDGDYLLSNSVITIADGQTTGSVTMTIQNDDEAEGVEVATITLANASDGLFLGGDINADVEIFRGLVGISNEGAFVENGDTLTLADVFVDDNVSTIVSIANNGAEGITVYPTLTGFEFSIDVTDTFTIDAGAEVDINLSLDPTLFFGEREGSLTFFTTAQGQDTIALTVLANVLQPLPDKQVFAFSSFEEPVTTTEDFYTDLLGADNDHQLVTNPGEPPIEYTSVGGELGFASFYVNTRNGVGLTDGDQIGVIMDTTVAGFIPGFTDGEKGYKLHDADGELIVSFDEVTLDPSRSYVVDIDYFINATSWESDDRIRIWVVVDGGEEIDILNPTEDIDNLGIEGQWLTGSADLSGRSTAILNISVDSNSGAESVYIDNIVFNEFLTPVPARVSFANSSIAVQEPGVYDITVSLDKATPTDQAVKLALTIDENLVAGQDYELDIDSLGGEPVVVIPAGASEGSFGLNILADEEIEDTETIQVEIVEASAGLELDALNASLEISVEDFTPIVSLTLSDDELIEENGTQIDVTVSSDKALLVDQSFSFTLTGTATITDDYVLANPVLNIAAGDSVATTTITVVDDGDFELVETVEVELVVADETTFVKLENNTGSINIFGTNAPDVAILQASDTLFDRDIVAVGSELLDNTRETEFSIQNVGTQELEVYAELELLEGAEFVLSETDTFYVDKNTTEPLVLTFSPQGFQGRRDARLVISTNDPQDSLIVLQLNAEAISLPREVFAFTSFEEPEYFTTRYIDLLDPDTDHALESNPGEPIVNYESTGGELGFRSFYYATRSPSSGLGDLTEGTPGDFIGVTQFTGNVGAFTDGAQGFAFSDPDGAQEIVLDTVHTAGLEDVVLELDYFLANTTWETNPNDKAIIWVITDTDSLNLLNTESGVDADIDNQGIEGVWNTASLALDGYEYAILHVLFESNSNAENLFIDNIRYSFKAAEPSTIGFEVTEVDIDEGQDFEVKLSLSPPAFRETNVMISFDKSMAITDTDYALDTATFKDGVGILTIDSAATELTFNLSVLADADVEQAEKMTFEIAKLGALLNLDAAAAKLDVNFIDSNVQDVTIQELRVNDENGVPTFDKRKVQTTGIVHGFNMAGGNGLDFNIIDTNPSQRAGINIQVEDGSSLGYTVTEGDQIEVMGIVSEINGLTIIQPLEITTVSQGNTLAEPIEVIDGISEENESDLIKTPIMVVEPGFEIDENNPYNILLSDLSGNLFYTMRVNDVSEAFEPGNAFIVVGFGSQFDELAPYEAGHVIVPRSMNDFSVLTPVEDELGGAQEITVFPNPANSQISFIGLTESTLVEIIDTKGHIVIKREVNAGEVVDTSSLSTGLYVIQLQTAGGTPEVRRLIINR
ncbi:MAG: T9SS type A sorting domain-containing protein [Bacteroidota bacterium]